MYCLRPVVKEVLSESLLQVKPSRYSKHNLKEIQLEVRVEQYMLQLDLSPLTGAVASVPLATTLLPR
jgi:hypothetical protein